MIFPSHDTCYRNTKAGAEKSPSYEMEIKNMLKYYFFFFYNLMLAAESRVRAMKPDALSGHRAYEPECI